MSTVVAPERATHENGKKARERDPGVKGMVEVVARIREIGNGILMNPMTEETKRNLLHGTPKQVKRDRRPEDIAREKIYRDPKGRTCVPTMNLVAALNHAGRSVKMGKKTIATATTTTLFSFAEFPDEFLVFDGLDENGDLPWVVDIRRGVMASGVKPVAVAIVRPKFPSWSLAVRVHLNEKLVGEDTLRKLFDEAGTNSGLCDFRPQKKGPFGRFRVVGWRVTPLPDYTEEVSEELTDLPWEEID